jgi:hypothetical protein
LALASRNFHVGIEREIAINVVNIMAGARATERAAEEKAKASGAPISQK